MKLLSLIQKVAVVAKRLQVLVWMLAAGALLGFFYLVFAEDSSLDLFILPCAVALGWSICLQGIASSFREVPQLPEEGERFFRRVRMRIAYGIAWFWAAIFFLSSLILIYMSIRSVMIALAG